MSGNRNSAKQRNGKRDEITALSVSGFKSIFDECRLEIRPLTILAGANSSGKSSAVQPLLLLKQTLDATYDPGALLLDGPNVRMTAADQLLSMAAGMARADSFRVSVTLSAGAALELRFQPETGKGFRIAQMNLVGLGESQWSIGLREGLTEAEIQIALERLPPPSWSPEDARDYMIERSRCFLQLRRRTPVQGKANLLVYAAQFEPPIRGAIHVPGLRGNPARTYPVTATGPDFPGTFEHYVASMVAEWQSGGRPELGMLDASLRKLGLTSKIVAKPLNEAQIELKVARLLRTPRAGTGDLVSIADVGFGVSQALPVVVALLAASPGQLVYIEQPEIHMHPRAQAALAELLADAARRGVHVVVETHSSLLLLSVQALVARGDLSPELVKLHWFDRDKGGATEVTSRDLDEAGAFGDWPEDFGDVELEAQSRYLDAADRRRAGV